MKGKERPPVTLVTGFLGSGKTTLLSQILKENRDTRFGILFNDFGNFAIEGQLLETPRRLVNTESTLRFHCQYVIDGDIDSAFESLLKQDTRIDHILIEDSSFSSSNDVARRQSLVPDTVLCVVDVTSFPDVSDPAVKRHLEQADFVFLSKSDIADKNQFEEVQNRLRQIRPGIPAFEVSSNISWLAVLYSYRIQPAARRTVVSRLQNRLTEINTHPRIEFLEYLSELPLDPDRLGMVFSSLDDNIIRVKGVVYFGDPSARHFKYVVQCVGSQKHLHSIPWSRGERRGTRLVFLGAGFDAKNLWLQLQACQVGVGA
jgi:G3E family GTPase